MSSSVRDLAAWLRLQLAPGRARFYGLGWNVSYTVQGEVQLGHSGAFNLGASTAVYLLPGESLGIVVLTKGQPIGVPESVAVSFLDLARFGAIQTDYFPLFRKAFAAITSQDYPVVRGPANPRPPLADLACVGTYANDYFGTIRVIRQEGGLVLRIANLDGNGQGTFRRA